MPDYIELQAISNFSFLRGGSHPEELVTQAKLLGYKGLGLADINSFSGIVRAHSAAKEAGLPFFVGVRFDLGEPALSILAYASERTSYGILCKLLTAGKTHAQKGSFELGFEELLANLKGIHIIVLAPDVISEEQFFLARCSALKDSAGSAYISLALTLNFSHNAARKIHLIRETSEYLQVPLVATGDVIYHVAERKPLQDVITCVRNKCTIQEAGFKLFQNSERHLKTPAEIYRLFREYPLALKRGLEIAEALSGFSLDMLRYEYPEEICPAGQSPLQYLKQLTWRGAKERYPNGVPDKVIQLLKQELTLIDELDYPKYFLTCYDIVRFARSQGILCQGRGAAANSAVCFCLGITSVDPEKIDLLFARFVSKERSEPPDIDIDFEHERREEVIQYIYQRYGRARAGLVCEVVTYRHRSATREVGKALGLSNETVGKLAKSIHRWTACEVSNADLEELGLSPNLMLQNTLTLAKELMGFPRHLSQHVGGFIISEGLLSETVPIGNAAMPNRTMIEWDKNDIEVLGMLKIDILGLGMLSCVRKALQYVNHKRLKAGLRHYEMHSIPREDAGVYEMICSSDTLGVFQIESRAQMSMLPRLKPRCFYDLVIEVAIVRPGPIQGNMVHPYLKRRAGLESVHYPDQRVRDILGKTLGVPIFQEQAMRLAIVLANFSPGEAEKLRRAMAAWKSDKGMIAIFRERIIKGMLQNGYTLQFAESCFNQLKGFSEYGFPESHAASFALIVYASAWLKKHHPSEFTCALLNSQPMGFYAPSQIVSDAKAHGVPILAIDINKSAWDSTLENGESGDTRAALRLGMRLVKGLGEKNAQIICDLVKSRGSFNRIQALWKVARLKGLKKSALVCLAKADAFGSVGLNSREALWEIRALPSEILPLEKLMLTQQEPVDLPSMHPKEYMFQDYTATGLSLKAHPLQFIRNVLDLRGAFTAQTLKTKTSLGGTVSAAGIVICRQRPHTAKGVVFLTLEDETGITNVFVKPEIFEIYRKEILSSSIILVKGTLDRNDAVVYINAKQIEELDRLVLERKASEVHARTALPGRSYSY